MAVAKIVTTQTDFSAGEVDATVIRADGNPVAKKGLRQCRNFRILDTDGLSNRFGRTAKFITAGARVTEVLMSPGNVFELVFGTALLTVLDANGAVVFTSTKLGDGVTTIPWTNATVKNIVWDIIGLSIYIAYPDGAPLNVPQVLTWDGVSTWTLATYAETINGTQKRTAFYRISPKGITLTPSAKSGAGITLTASSALFTAAWVGTRVRYVDRQILITGFTNSTTVTATVEEVLNNTWRMTSNGGAGVPNQSFSIGDVVFSNQNTLFGEVVAVTATTFDIIARNGTQPFSPATAELWVGPTGSVDVTGNTTTAVAPEATTHWDNEVMNTLQGYPSSVFADQNRLGFCNFPTVPAGIAWSAIGLPNDLYVSAASPDLAMFELAPGKSQVLYVVAGMQSSEFVFTDIAVYAIPISQANPLKPGSVAFDKISDDGCAPVRPSRMQNIIIYINAGLSSVRAIMTIGAFNRTNESRDISELHNHLFNSPIAIACPNADGPFPERYFYVLNADGTAVAGKVDVEDGNVRPNTLPGWTPISGNGLIKWISARANNVWFTVTYTPGAVTVAELMDSTQYLDAALSYNAVPTALTPPGGKGPLWWLPSGACTVMDLGTRSLGAYVIDANGFLVPQFTGGENLASAQLVVGQMWTATAEPIIPSPPPGQDSQQRLLPRQISQIMTYVQQCTGFMFAKLFSEKLRAGSPAYGDTVNTERVLQYNQGDDAALAPPQREDTYFWRPSGSSANPRIAIVKDTSGPLVILEITTEVTV